MSEASDTAADTAAETRADTASDSEGDAVGALSALVAELTARIQALEARTAQWHPEVTEDVLLAISAACAAYLGERATIKQVHLRRGGTWASQGRAAAQQSHADLHGYGDRQTAPTPGTTRHDMRRAAT